MTGLADVDGFKNLHSSVRVAGLPTPGDGGATLASTLLAHLLLKV